MLCKNGKQERDFWGVYFIFSLVYFSMFWGSILIKQLFHSRLLDMRLVIANSALRASLAIYLLISNARPWNNCYIDDNVVKRTTHFIYIQTIE